MRPDALQRLRNNRLMRSPAEAAAFEGALEEVAASRELDLLPDLHLILDDGCRQHEVMFGLIHLLESFDVEAQLNALLEMLPELVKQAPSWAKVLHFRILNDDEARGSYQRLVSGASEESRSAARTILTAIAAENEEPLKSAATSTLTATGG